MDKFLITPDQADYNVQDGEETLRTQLQGGQGRFRADVLNASYTVRVSWTCSLAKLSYIKGFYKTRVVAGSKPFLIDLMLNGGPDLKEYKAYFMPNSIVLAQITGATYKVTAQLEVIPNEDDEQELINQTLMYEAYGENMFNYDLSELLLSLNNLVNVEMPSLEVFDA